MGNLIPRREIKPFVIYERRPKPKGSTKYVVFKGNDQVIDFGKYSTAIRWCKAQSPRQPVHIVINADDKTAVSTHPADFTIIDGEFRHTAHALVDPAMVAGMLGVNDEQ